MASCNLCDADTTGSNRTRGMCKRCYRGDGALRFDFSCILCGTDRNFYYQMGVIRTKKGNSHTVCSDCWEGTSNKDNFSWRKLPKKNCQHCKKGNVLRYTSVLSCKSCLKEKKLETCEECWGEVRTTYVKDNKKICKECVKRFYVECTHCNIEFSKRGIDDKRNGKQFSHSVCDKCFEISIKAIHNYSHKPNPEYKPSFIDEKDGGYDGVWNRGRKILYLGVEVEMECSQFASAIAHSVTELSKNRVYNKGDSSITYGFEMVSHPMTLEYHTVKKDAKGELINPEKHMNWEEIFKYLLSKGCLSHNTKTCGLHIHANKSFMTDTDLKKLDIFINSHTREISQFARRSNSHAQYKKLSKDDFKRLNNTGGRYALNMSPASTVEFRMFKGTLKYSTFMASLQFVDASIRFVKEAAWKDICNVEKSWKLFIAFIDDNKYTELAKYMRLRKLRKAFREDSSSIAQMIAKTNATKLTRFEERDEIECA